MSLGPQIEIDHGEVADAAWKALLAADAAFVAARETGSGALYNAALLVLQRRSGQLKRALDALVESLGD